MATKLSAISKSDFEMFPKLFQYFDHDEYNFTKVYELDISNEKVKKIPQLKLMECFFNLKVLDISNNLIKHICTKPLRKGVPLLEKLNLKGNLIEDLANIVKQGNMPKLHEVNLLDNPITKNQHFHQILGEIIFPSEHTKADPIKLCTATYTSIANKLDPPSWETIDLRSYIFDGDKAVQDNASKVEVNEYTKYVLDQQKKNEENSKYVSFVCKDCPYRKIGHFKGLLSLNERRITIFDIFQISEYKDYHDIVINELEEKTKEKFAKIDKKRRQGQVIEKPIKPQKDKQEYYLNRYEKKMRKKEEEFEPILHLNDKEAKEEQNYLKVIHRMDQINYDRRQAKKAKGSNLAIWEKPDIDKYLESAEYLNKDNGQFNKEFNMLPEDIKKEGKELKEHKIAKIEYDKQMKAHYLESLKRVYRFREFVDETNFNKIFSKDQIEEIEEEMKIYTMAIGGADKMINKAKRQIKKKELKLEYKDWELKTSSSEMEDSSEEEEEQSKQKGKQENENFYETMHSVKESFNKKMTTFGEDTVVQIDHYLDRKNSFGDDESPMSTINRTQMTGKETLKNPSTVSKNIIFREDPTVSQTTTLDVNTSNLINKTTLFAGNTMQSDYTLVAPPESNQNITQIISPANEENHSIPNKKESKTVTINTNVSKKHKNESKSPKKQTKTDAAKPQLSLMATRIFNIKKTEPKSGPAQVIDKSKLSNNLGSPDISSFMQSNISNAGRGKKKPFCHVKNFFSNKEDHKEKPVNLDKLLNFKIDKTGSKKIDNSSLGTKEKSGINQSLKSIEKRSRDTNQNNQQDQVMFDSYLPSQSKESTLGPFNMNLHKKTVSVQKEKNTGQRDVKSARTKNYQSEDFMANKGIIDHKIIEESHQRFETENQDQKENLIEPPDLGSANQEKGTAEFQQITEEVLRFEDLEQNDMLANIDQVVSDPVNLEATQPGEASKVVEPLNYDVILKQMPDESQLPSWRINDMDLAMTYANQNALENQVNIMNSKSQKMVSFNKNNLNTDDSMENTYNSKRTSQQYKIKYGMPRAASAQNINQFSRLNKYFINF